MAEKTGTNTKLCKHCKMEIPASAKVCPHCRKKQKKGIGKWILLGIVILVIIGAASGGSKDKGGTKKVGTVENEAAHVSGSSQQPAADSATESTSSAGAEESSEMVVETGILSENEKMRILSVICDGLLFLHAAVPPIIHRDIKAENILIDIAGNVKIIDYDAAKQYHPGKTRDTVLIGTEGSAAPEQYGFRQSDERTDVYAAGVLIRRMFPDDPAMQQIAGKATQMDPAQRYQSVEELKRACYGSRRWYRYIPGFRTLKIRKMIAAVALYAMMICMAAGLRIEQVKGPGDLLLNRVTFFMIGIVLVFFFAYRKTVGKRFGLLRSKNRILRWAGYLISIVLIVMVPVLLMTVIEIILYGPAK